MLLSRVAGAFCVSFSSGTAARLQVLLSQIFGCGRGLQDLLFGRGVD